MVFFARKYNNTKQQLLGYFISEMKDRKMDILSQTKMFTWGKMRYLLSWIWCVNFWLVNTPSFWMPSQAARHGFQKSRTRACRSSISVTSYPPATRRCQRLASCPRLPMVPFLLMILLERAEVLATVAARPENAEFDHDFVATKWKAHRTQATKDKWGIYKDRQIRSL